MAVQMLDYLADAMTRFAHLGYSIQQVLREHHAQQHQPVRSEKIGRNEPCPFLTSRWMMPRSWLLRVLMPRAFLTGFLLKACQHYNLMMQLI